MGRFRDFSTYKSNELKHFFEKKSLLNYLENKSSLEKKGFGRFRPQIFSAIAIFVVNSKTDLSAFISVLQTDTNIYVFILIQIVYLIFVVGLLYLFCLIIFSLMFRPAISLFENLRIFNRAESLDKYSPHNLDGIIDEFKHKVDDQICLAVSIFDAINDENAQHSQLYLLDSFRHLNVAIKYLSKNLLAKELFLKTLHDPKEDSIRKYRVRELINTSKILLMDIIKKMGESADDLEIQNDKKSIEENINYINQYLNARK